MGRVHFIGGEKGGVGKSLTSRLLAQFFIDMKKAFTGFDLDQSHGTFSRFYPEYTSPIRVDDFSSLDSILELAEAKPDHDLIVDLAAQTSGHLQKWIEDSDVFDAFDELGYQVFLWHVMDDGADSTMLLGKTLDTYSNPNLRFIVVQNMGRGVNFENFQQSSTFQKVIQRPVYFVTMKQLEPKLAQKIDFSNSSFWAAANNRQIMSIVERKRVGVWLRNTYLQFVPFLARPQTPDQQSFQTQQQQL